MACCILSCIDLKEFSGFLNWWVDGNFLTDPKAVRFSLTVTNDKWSPVGEVGRRFD